MKKALYRQFRPQTFDQLLDQDHITTVLKNQLRQGNIGHAYLFSGSRGTGKTSCARIFARAVNCLHPVDGNPCNECENCRAILEERTLDVVEMDAASNRGIDDIRDLRSKVLYPPTQLKYKVYIIDEAHMITDDAFNVLLKIMEEPPSHLIFILATTELQKIPVTIQSRVQRFAFKRISLAAIEKQLKMVSETLGKTMDDEAAHALAVAADGAMRDALSLLQEVIADESDHITAAQVTASLGTVGYGFLGELTRAVLQGQPAEALDLGEKLIASGKDCHTFMKEWVEYFRLLLLVKGLEGRDSKLPINSQERERLRSIASLVSMERIVDSLEILIDSELLIRKSDFSEAVFLSAVAKLVDYQPREAILSRLGTVEAKLKTVESWKDPEKLVRNELYKAMKEGGAVLSSPSSQPTGEAEEAGPAAEALHPAAEPSHPVEEKPMPAEERLPLAGEAGRSKGQEFERDPLAWLEARQEDFLSRAGQVVNQRMLFHFGSIEAGEGKVWLTYPPHSMSQLLVENNKEKLAAILEEMTGEHYELVVGQKKPASLKAKAAPSEQVKAGAGEKPEKKRGDLGNDPEDREKTGSAGEEDRALQALREAFSEDMVEVEDN